MVPVFQGLSERFAEFTNGPLGETASKFQNFIGVLKESLSLFMKNVLVPFWKNLLIPLFEWIAQNAMPILSNIVNFMGNTLITAFSFAVKSIGALSDILSGLLQFIIGRFTGDWSMAWLGIKQTFLGIWELIQKGIKTSTNFIISVINALLHSIQSMQNSVATALNSLNINMPSWLQDLTGFGNIGFNLGYWKAPQIPYLATGAVIPPNAPFAAILGDQKHGNNIEAPEGLLRNIMREELGNLGNSGNNTYIFQAALNRKIIFDQMIEEAKLRQTVTGKNDFLLGT